MVAKALNDITESDLQALIYTGSPESKQLEYKQALPDTSDAGKVKFLREVTAFANMQGGDLIYGISAKDGIPQEITPLQITSEDQLLLRLESLCADGVDPRLTGLVQARFVPLNTGGKVLVVRISKSWNAPHRVTTGGHAHFYGRNASGCYQLDVGELREAFTLSQTVAERIHNFRADRLMKYSYGGTPVPLMHSAAVMLHLVPLQSMSSSVRIDIASHQQILRKLSPTKDMEYKRSPNLDGYLAHNHYESESATAYAQMFRNGIIESVVVYPQYGEEKVFYGGQYELDIVGALRGQVLLLKELEIVLPIYVFLSVIGIAGYRFGAGSFRLPRESHIADRDRLILPEISIEDWSADPVTFMRPAFDMVWNSFGYLRSFNYDDNGKWNPR